MFNNHRMSCVLDLAPISQDISIVNNYTIAAITTSYIANSLPNMHYAGVLVPPTSMLMYWADGDYDIIRREYPKYLMSKECDDMIVAFLAALTKRNVILYIPLEEYEVYGPILLNHIYYIYGIVCDTYTSTYSFDINKIPLIVSKFYAMDIMDLDNYLASYPVNCPFPDFVIPKLSIDMNPFPQGATFDQYRAYFNNMNYNRLQV